MPHPERIRYASRSFVVLQKAALQHEEKKVCVLHRHPLHYIFGVNLSENCILVDIDSVGLEAAVDYIYAGNLDLTSANKNVIKKSLLPGELMLDQYIFQHGTKEKCSCSGLDRAKLLLRG